MKYISLFGQKFKLAEFMLIACCVAILIYLGTWQLSRLKEKETFIAQIEANIANPAIKIDKTQFFFKLYTKIQLNGHFIDGQNIFLYGRRTAYPEKDGYYVLTPFEDNFGNIYLVSRGWVTQKLKTQIENFKSPIKETITAFVMSGEKKRLFVPENDLKKNIWFTLDLKQAKNQLNLTEDRFYLLQVNSQNLPPALKPLSSNYLTVVRNDHLEYAITWYSLAAFLCIIYFIYNRKKKL